MSAHLLSVANHTASAPPLEPAAARQGSHHWAVLVLAGLCFVYVANALERSVAGVKAPAVGYRSVLEPGWLVGLRFIQGAGPMIREGYSKFKTSMFRVRRNDGDILVISHKYIDELRNLPDAKVSAIRAHVNNVLGRYSTTTILLESDLHTRVLQTKLTPSLGALVPAIKSALDHALAAEVPDCAGGWVEVQVYDVLVRIVARISARVFLGEAASRNDEWLATSIHYTESVFKTVMVLRRFPAWLHPVVAVLLPSYWQVRAHLAAAKRIISPMVRQRRRAQAAAGSAHERPQDLLQWMMDAADEHDGQPDKLAHRQLLVSLASIHTSTMAAAHALYDLCAHPEYFAPLRREASQALAEDGGWHKTTLTKLRQLDSFLKESQRTNPPSLLGFNRVVRAPLRLSDGTTLPAGTQFSMPSDAIAHDPAHVDRPDAFDGFRYARLRQDPQNANRFQFASTDASSLHFGHGKYACPGRFFAANEIKMILAHLLRDFDFQYPAGQRRPANMSADEWVFPDPSTKLLMRRRHEGADAVLAAIG